MIRELWAVVCVHPNGHETVIRSLVFDNIDQAERAARKRDRLPQAEQLQFRHRVARVTPNPRQTGPNDKFLLSPKRPQDDGGEG